MRRQPNKELLTAINAASNDWYARANGVLITAKCPVCRVMKKQSLNKEDICLNCPISKHNNDLGCPDLIQQYKESDKDDERKEIARKVAEFIESVKIGA